MVVNSAIPIDYIIVVTLFNSYDKQKNQAIIRIIST